MVACARMYAWSPSLSAAWRRLLEWVPKRSGVPMEVIEHPAPARLDALWTRDDMGCVFMCGFPWALRSDRPQLLVAPVPAPPRYGGRPVYFTEFLVRAESPYQELEDTFGGRLAYSIEDSHSGYNAPRYHLLRYRTSATPRFYAEVRGPYVSQRPILHAMLEGEADVGAFDSYALDLLRVHNPDLMARFRVIGATVAAPSPPLVASPGIDPATCARVRDALLDAHRAPEIADTMASLLLARFVPVQPADFEVMLERKRLAEEAGYPKLA